MDKILETIMNFINENTTLLIIICVFLIFVLIGYLIDNSIKTKRLERQMSSDGSINNEPEVIETPIEKKKEELVIEETPIEEPIVEEINDDTVEIPTIELPKEEEKNEIEEVTESVGNQVNVDPKVNDILLRDFANNGVSNVDTEEKEDEISLNPISNIDSIELPKEEEPEVKEPVYKNDKKLSDIFKKKDSSVETNKQDSVKLESTIDFSNELDRILQKINDDNSSNDSTLDETTDYTNMF